MRSRNNYSGLEPEIVKQLKYHAWRLKQMKCFESQEIEAPIQLVKFPVESKK